jgi:excisionase family DNA binding protein
MSSASGIDRPASGPATAAIPPDNVTDQLAPVLAQILAGLRDLRDRFAGARKEFYTVEEVAELTGRTPYTVRRWIAERRIEATRVSGTGPRGRLLVAHSQLQKLIAAGMGGAVPSLVGG